MHRGLRFCNLDLHIHTPKSECFIEPDVTPEMIVDQAIAVGMKAIAITDHNSAEWVDEIKQAAEGKGLTVFPGVEITVQPGVHVLTIFPEDRTEDHVTDLLSALGLKKDDRGKNSSLVTKYGIQEVVSIIRKEYGALPILAHIDGEKGAWKVLRNHGQTLLQLWQAAEFAAVEIVGETLPEGIGKDPYSYIPAYYWASDNPHPENPTKHSHHGIGARFSRFKLSEPITWEGLRLCFQDPDSRIRPPIEVPITHPIIQQISIDGGFLAGFDVDLNPNLNCVIGGRGTGKSCLLELVRYAFNIVPKTDANHTQAEGILKSGFPAGSRISIRFNLGDRMAYRLERTANQVPKIFRDGEQEPLLINPADLLPLQVYGQKEVYEISRDPSFQLRLLDNYLAEALKPLQNRENELLRQLRENAAEIVRLEEEIEADREQVARLGTIEEELRRMEQQGFVARLQQKSLYDREKDLLENAQDQVIRLTGEINTFLNTHRLKTDRLCDVKINELPNRDTLAFQRDLLIQVDALVEHCLTDLAGQITERWTSGQEDRLHWQNAFLAQEESFQELLREFQAGDKALKPERYIQLQSEQRRLSDKAQEVTEKRVQITDLQENRQNLLDQLRQVRRSQYEIRRDMAGELTQALGKKVRIKIWPQGHRDAYQKQLTDLFKGSGVRKDTIEQLAIAEAPEPEQPAQKPIPAGGQIRYLLPEIPRYLDPIDLAAAIRQESELVNKQDSSLLADAFGIGSEAMRRNIVNLTPEKLFELETLGVPDLPVIELQVSRGDLGYKQLDTLSIGQKCTALLSLVLLESPAPLLIDQPEDDLDNHFIFDQIVSTLRHAKEKRQFIIATHNANIPVSGDAELIIVLNADERKGWVEEEGIGSIDTLSIKQSVERILEGGEIAFKIRKEKYGI